MSEKFVVTYICPNCDRTHGQRGLTVVEVAFGVGELLREGCHSISINTEAAYTEALLDHAEAEAKAQQ